MESWTVYILRCSDDRYYVGCTADLDARLGRHRNGHCEFTKSRLPVSVALTIEFLDRHRAFQFEKYLKSGSGRAFAKRHFL